MCVFAFTFIFTYCSHRVEHCLHKRLPCWSVLWNLYGLVKMTSETKSVCNLLLSVVLVGRVIINEDIWITYKFTSKIKNLLPKLKICTLQFGSFSLENYNIISFTKKYYHYILSISFIILITLSMDTRLNIITQYIKIFELHFIFFRQL